MPSLDPIRLRASRSVELKRLGDLAPEQREVFLGLEVDPDFYGLFVPKPPLLMNVQAVARPTAALFESLANPAVVGDVAEHVIDLVLDGILEMESDDGFVWGADAMAILDRTAGVPPADKHASRVRSAGETPARQPARTPAVRCLSRPTSIDALLHAQDLETRVPHLLMLALYHHNCIPLSPYWRARFASVANIVDPARAHLEREWVEVAKKPGWRAWIAKTPLPHAPDQPTYKLYVSPVPERIGEVFAIVVRVLSSSPATAFKIGDSAAGLLRPDKLVAYFATREALDDVAAVLRRELAGCDAQGVPFTAAVEDSGLLSWAVDPPDTERALRWLGRDSWRLWLAKRLAAAMSVAKAARTAAAVEPWRFAIERVRRLGVDPATWTPSPSLWSSA